ncbi:hypothetical protein EfmAA96_28380 [Enterococcus faecium]|nr:hypothetical protein EfmAA96_28380 [Enterococcus faecium]
MGSILSKADLIFYNGVNLETGGNAWFTKLVKNANKEENKDYFAASDGIDVIAQRSFDFCLVFLEGREHWLVVLWQLLVVFF